VIEEISPGPSFPRGEMKTFSRKRRRSSLLDKIMARIKTELGKYTDGLGCRERLHGEPPKKPLSLHQLPT
jgi:hypothetical protein